MGAVTVERRLLLVQRAGGAAECWRRAPPLWRALPHLSPFFLPLPSSLPLPPLPPLPAQQGLTGGLGAYAFLASSSAVKKMEPPMPIQITRGCQPLRRMVERQGGAGEGRGRDGSEGRAQGSPAVERASAVQDASEQEQQQQGKRAPQQRAAALLAHDGGRAVEHALVLACG